MRITFLVITFVLSRSVLALDIPETPWLVKCSETRCFMQIPTAYKGPNGMEQVGLVVAYDKQKNEPEFIGFMLPSSVSSKDGLMITFVDTVPDGESFKLEPSKDGFIGLPINDCNKNYCASRVHSQIKTKDNKDINLLSELLKREHVWLLFKRNEKSERAMIPVYKFRDEFAKIMTVKESNKAVK